MTTRVRQQHLREMKARGEKITMLTAYDFPTAAIFDAAGVDTILVGDSVGNNMLGYDTTLPVTLDAMIHHTAAVQRGTRRAFVIGDLPFGSYEAGPQQALASSVRMMKETGCSAVKFEGGVRVADQIAAVTAAGIPVVAHIGFTPQSENLLGGKRVQGRAATGGPQAVLADAHAVAQAGAVAVVLEMIPGNIAAQVTAELAIPTIGIGAGPDCDGQVLVWLDIAGMSDWSPSFAKRYAEVGAALSGAAAGFISEVKSGVFPDQEKTFI